MYLLTQIDYTIESTKAQLQKQNEIREWVDQNQERFSNLPNATLCNEYIDFDNLSHQEVMQVILAFGGKWDRTPNGSKINYIRKPIEGCPAIIRCYNGTPPAGCRVEYEEVTIPARTERRAKLCCKPLQELVDEQKALPSQTVLLNDEIPF